MKLSQKDRHNLLVVCLAALEKHPTSPGILIALLGITQVAKQLAESMDREDEVDVAFNAPACMLLVGMIRILAETKDEGRALEVPEFGEWVGDFYPRFIEGMREMGCPEDVIAELTSDPVESAVA